jgi:hypothetical protein
VRRELPTREAVRHQEGVTDQGGGDPVPAVSEKSSPLFLLAMFVALGSGVLAPFIVIGIVVWMIFT